MTFTQAQATAINALVAVGHLVRGRASSTIENGVANRTAGFLLANGYAVEGAENTLVPTAAARKAAKQLAKVGA